MEPSWAHLPEFLPPWMLPLWLALFGLVVGSFLNVVIHRLPRGNFPGPKRSACPSCARQIRWHENVPVISWLALRGKCAGCGEAISPRYATVELLAGGLALGCWFVFGWSLALPIALAFSWAILALVFIDLEHFLLPDAITLPGTVIALAVSFKSPLTSPGEALLGVLLAIFALEGLNLAYRIYKGIDGFGQGDTKMLMMVGAVLGWKLAMFTLVAGSMVGAVVSIPLVLWAGRHGGDEDAEEQPLEDEGTAAAGQEADERPSALAELLPEEPEDLLSYLSYLALASSFLGSPLASPQRALAGFLLGLALLLAARRLHAAAGGAPTAFAIRLFAALPLVGAITGCPTGAFGAVAGGITALLWAVALPLLVRVLPGRSESAEEDDEQELKGLSAGLQAALPFGVFLGLGALVSLFVGEDVIAWYLSFLPQPDPGY
jgi:leader peptidase (prepilin peptidase)/N-methyltransferase